MRLFFVHHVTSSVNSICHLFGRRPFASDDESRNVWPLALLSAGESWHNNHHAFPTSAFLGLERGQFDLGGLLVRALERAGLAWNVKRPAPEQLEKRRRA